MADAARPLELPPVQTIPSQPRPPAPAITPMTLPPVEPIPDFGPVGSSPANPFVPPDAKTGHMLLVRTARGWELIHPVEPAPLVAGDPPPMGPPS